LETDRVCPSCGRDVSAPGQEDKSAGVELFFMPGEPEPAPAPAEADTQLPVSERDAAIPPAPAAPAAEPAAFLPSSARSTEEPPKAELIGLAAVNARVLSELQRSEAGKRVAAEAARNPRAAAAAAAAAGVLILALIYFMLRPAAAPASGPAASPADSAPAPTADFVRPAATFAAEPRVVVNGAPEPQPAPAAAPPPAPAPAPAPAAAPSSPAPSKAAPESVDAWTFEGVVFDLLTTRGVFAVRLVFVDDRGGVAGETETGADGRYKIEIPSGAGYTVKIAHGDYTGRYIDDPDGSLRTASSDERRLLMQAAAHNRTWVGNPKKAVYRDLALVPSE
jgi:hypothetical protein